MRRWKVSVRRVVLGTIVAALLASAAGWRVAVSAQQSMETRVAVAQANITNLTTAQVATNARLDVIDAKLSDIDSTLSRIEGVGSGAFILLTIMGMLGIGFNFYTRRPNG